jgi:hypothetical protein
MLSSNPAWITQKDSVSKIKMRADNISVSEDVEKSEPYVLLV